MAQTKPQVRFRPSKIFHLLAVNNKTLSWLADKLAISTPYMSQLAAGDRNASPAIRKKAMLFFNIKNFNDLFTIQDGTPKIKYNSKGMAKRQ